MFGGNSNWRGPVWFPINVMLIRALLNLYVYYGDEFTVECPTGSGRQLNLYEVAREISDRLTGTFLRGRRRPPPGARRSADLAERPALARPAAVLRVLPRRQRRRHRRQPPDRLDRQRGAAAPAVPRRQLERMAQWRGSRPAAKRKPAATAAASRGRRATTGHAMTGWPDQPVIYEVNTAVWLAELSRAAAGASRWPTWPSDWDAVTPAGVDAVWLMGVWERSPAGLAMANANAELLASFREALPDLRARRRDRLAVLRAPLRRRRGFRRAGRAGRGPRRAGRARRPAAPRLRAQPRRPRPPVGDRAARSGSSGAARPTCEADPAGWLAVGGQVLARGRDPYFPPWPDVVQLDAFSPGAAGRDGDDAG